MCMVRAAIIIKKAERQSIRFCCADIKWKLR